MSPFTPRPAQSRRPAKCPSLGSQGGVDEQIQFPAGSAHQRCLVLG